MPLPTFLMIGAQKAATTTVYHWLRQHPDIFLPDVKETNFFLDEGAWDEGPEWYRSLYAEESGQRHRGDVSPAYTMFPRFLHVPERAAQLLPEARLVYLIREPVSRMVSAWTQLVGAGHEHRELVDALVHEAHYSHSSMYGLQLDQWLHHYDREALLILRAEDLADEPGAGLDRILAHLDLEQGWRPQHMKQRWNTSDDKVTVAAPVRTLQATARTVGLERVARTLRPQGRVGRRFRRPLPPPILDADLVERFTDLFRADAARLREIVGDDMDLWNLA